MLKILNKEFLNNFIGLSSINIIGMLIPIVTMPYLSRVLGADGYGIVLLFSTLSVFMLIIIDYSTNIAGVREMAENKTGHVGRSLIYSKYQRLRFILSLLFIPLSLMYSLFFIPSFSLAFSLEVLTVSALGYYLTAPWFHQGTSTLSIFSFITVSVRLLQLTLIFFIVNDKDSVSTAIRLNAYAFLMTGLVLYFYRRRRMAIQRQRNEHSLAKDFKEGFDAFIGEFSPNFYSNIPPLIIGAMVSPIIFACYSIAIRIINISGSFQSIAAKSVYPLVVKGKSSLQALMIINLTLSTIPFFAILMYSKDIIRFFLGEGYALANIYLLVCSPSIILYSILCSFSYGYFLPQRLDALFKRISVISSLIPVAIGYPLIHFYQAYGAIIMLLLARGLFVFLFAYHYIKREKYRVDFH